jgi:hypothetical protein
MGRKMIALLLFAAPVFAASIGGEWTGTGTSKDQKQDFYFVFIQDGTHLSGSGGSGLYDQNVIQNGKIDGNKISFDISPGTGSTVLHFELAADGEVLKGTLELVKDHESVCSTVELKKDKT